MAHHNFSILKKLIDLIDDERNDIYIHIDAKVDEFDFKFFKDMAQKSEIYFINRTNVSWGGFSQIKCELELLKASISKSYSYYHLLSGIDLPLKSQDYIHEFFNLNEGKEFVDFTAEWDNSRVKYIHLFNENGRAPTVISKCKRIISKIFIKVQKIIDYDRIQDYEFYKGSNWFSITNDLAMLVVSKEKEIEKRYKNTILCDEVFLQTIIYHSHFKHNLFPDYSIRAIDWERGGPYIYRKEDFIDLINSDKVFARKFDENIDNEIVDMIYQSVSSKQ